MIIEELKKIVDIVESADDATVTVIRLDSNRSEVQVADMDSLDIIAMKVNYLEDFKTMSWSGSLYDRVCFEHDNITFYCMCAKEVK